MILASNLNSVIHLRRRAVSPFGYPREANRRVWHISDFIFLDLGIWGELASH